MILRATSLSVPPVEEHMKPLWDLFKEVGWIGVIGIFFLVAGMALGFGLSPKDFLELNSAAWTTEKKLRSF